MKSEITEPRIYSRTIKQTHCVLYLCIWSYLTNLTQQLVYTLGNHVIRWVSIRVMSDTAESVVSVDLQGKECSQPTILHLMPCEIDAGSVSKAQVNCYFTSTMKEDSPNGSVALLVFCAIPT